METKLTIRKTSKRYYQLGYYDCQKWVNVRHLGTADKINQTYQELERIKKIGLNITGNV